MLGFVTGGGAVVWASTRFSVEPQPGPANIRQQLHSYALVHVDTIRYLLMEVDGSAREISRKYQQISAIIGKQNASRITLDCPMKYYDIL